MHNLDFSSASLSAWHSIYPVNNGYKLQDEFLIPLFCHGDELIDEPANQI